MSELPVVIVGGGISGLVLAWELSRAGQPWLLLEQSERLGGNIQTQAHDGFLYDVGPDAFLRNKPAGVALCRELGLENQLIEQHRHGVYVVRDGALYPMPEGLSLGVPTRLGPLLDTPLLSELGKARALLEPFVPPLRRRQEESIDTFLRRRVGAEMTESLAAPLLAGVFAGDSARLSMDAAFPQLVAFEQDHGSLFSGFSGGKKPWQALWGPPSARGSSFLSLRRGMGQLIERLVADLPAERVLHNTPVTGLTLDGGQPVVLHGSGTLRARHVVLTGAPGAAARVLQGSEPELARQLAAVPGASTATVFFALERARMAKDFDGSGFIVPPGEGKILAATWVSSKWAGRAPADAFLVRAFVGGVRRVGGDVMQQSDAELVQLARGELERVMGELGPSRFERVYRYRHGTPQLELGHGERMAAVTARLGELPWLSLAGPGYAGVGIPDCIQGARALAERLLSH